MWRYAMLMVFVLACVAQAEERTLTVTAPMYFLPAPKAIVVVKADDKPADPKTKPLASGEKVPATLIFNAEGPVDVWYIPKDGLPVRAAKGLKLTLAKSELKLNDHLGVIALKGDDQPRGKIIITPYDDEGPETKKHLVVQSASSARSDVAVLPGDYAVWIVPENGARARKIVDKVRVLAGKTVNAD